MYSVIVNSIAVFLTGLAIKIMDDVLDRKADIITGKQTWAGKMEEKSLPYALSALVIAMTINPTLSGSLFLAAYGIGMFVNLRERLSLLEIILSVSIGILLYGFMEMVSSYLVLISVDTLDDMIDERVYIPKWHLVTNLLVFLTSLIISLIFDVPKVLMVYLVLFPIIFLLEGGRKPWHFNKP